MIWQNYKVRKGAHDPVFSLKKRCDTQSSGEQKPTIGIWSARGKIHCEKNSVKKLPNQNDNENINSYKMVYKYIYKYYLWVITVLPQLSKYWD